MPKIRLEDVTMIYPFQKTGGLFHRKEKEKILKQQMEAPYTSNEGVIALQHFSTVINEGEFLVILGPSGSGKSTLLRIIAGLERQSLGDIYFNDENYNNVRAEDRDVAMVFQNYSLYPNQTVFKNIAFPLEVEHVPRAEIEEEVKKVALLLGLQNKLEKLPQDLSGGEKQRVAIARSLIKKPSVLLFDEPFSNLDVLLRRKLRNELKKIHREYKTTFVYVTHDQYDALSLADRIIILNDGIKQMDADIEEVYNRPQNLFCAKFISSNNLNVFEDVEIDKNGNVILFDHSFTLGTRERKALQKHRNVTLAVRGTNISIEKEGVEAIIDYVEMIEADLLIHTRIDDVPVIVMEKADGREGRYMRGQTVHLCFDKEHFHFFDEEGERI